MIDLYANFPAFLLMLVRVSSFFATLPLFSYKTIPVSHRIGVAFFLTWIMFFTMDQPQMSIDGDYYMLIIKEALVGLLIGLVAYIILAAVQIAGAFIDFQMGFAIANVIDPQTGAQSPLVGQYLYTFALLLLLAINGHHLLLDGIFYSYQFIPIDRVFLPLGDEEVIGFIVKTFNQVFIIAFQMSFPVVSALFLVDVALGIVARTVPQLNVFVVGIPLKIGVSFIVLILVMSAMFMVVQELFETMIYTMRSLMGLLGGR
ncbi:flagellar biosynthetic protein FliR [Litchfieldia salsa]|uniref:Flagellar biosynthetic protein FliR n=1 Tax=Litchfieldia salsa TaxID=930152 RepID=A0A1H0R6J0_9BACI|nr:flagellar biosynthetic protein FliR [Litchfieldia salsa]SDP25035.1 flagellar biosynthetic protein FliR [Litchfieldia salsa]